MFTVNSFLCILANVLVVAMQFRSNLLFFFLFFFFGNTTILLSLPYECQRVEENSRNWIFMNEQLNLSRLIVCATEAL